MGSMQLSSMLRPRLVRSLPALLWCGVIFWASSQSDPALAPPIPFSDKVMHFGAYGVLGFLSAFALAGWGRKGPTIVAATLLATLYGISDEFHQAFVPGRDFDPFDMLADALGSLAGAWSYFFLGLSAWLERWSGSFPRPGKKSGLE